MASKKKKKKTKKRRPFCPRCKQNLQEYQGFISEWGKFAGLLCKNPTCIHFMNVRKVSRFFGE